jgi:hypothetical protein
VHVLLELVVVEGGLLLLQEIVERCLLCLHHQVHLLLELVLVVEALVPVVVVVALGLELGGPVVTTYFSFSTFLMTQQTHVTVYYYFLTRSYDSLIQICPEDSCLYI